MYICYIRRFFLFFFLCALETLGLILVQHFLKDCGNAAMPWSGKNTVTVGVDCTASALFKPGSSNKD